MSWKDKIWKCQYEQLKKDPNIKSILERKEQEYNEVIKTLRKQIKDLKKDNKNLQQENKILSLLIPNNN